LKFVLAEHILILIEFNAAQNPSPALAGEGGARREAVEG
jgi:hypothetical protein